MAMNPGDPLDRPEDLVEDSRASHRGAPTSESKGIKRISCHSIFSHVIVF
jgi:hypothetical protein